MNWRIIFTITKKDLLEAVKNANIFISMLVPILLWALFNIITDSDSAAYGFNEYLFIMFVVISLGMAGCFVMPALIVEEREKRTFQYLMTTPASILDVLLAKVLVSLIFAALMTATLVVLEGVQIGNSPATYLLLLLGALFMTIVGLLMGILFSNMQQINTWAMLVIFLMIAPSWFTSLNSPIADNVVFKFLPTYYLIRGLSSTLSGASIANIVGDLIILAGSVLIAFLLAIWLLERKRRSNSI